MTGASGFIGRWVARQLSLAGAKLWLPARSASSLEAICAAYKIEGQRLQVDLSHRGAFVQLYAQVRPQVTFHLVGYGVDPTEREEASATALNERLIEEISETVAAEKGSDWPGLRLVNLGSGAEYGNLEGPLTERSEPRPLDFYGRTKLAGTRALIRICERTGLPAVTARAFTVYGPGEHPGRLLPSVLAAARSGNPVRLTSGEQRRDFTFVGDVAEGLLRLGALTSAAPAVVNLATGTLTSVREFAECAARLVGLRPAQLLFGALAARPNEVRHGLVDVGLLHTTLHWIPGYSLCEGIQATIDFESRLDRAGD